MSPFFPKFGVPYSGFIKVRRGMVGAKRIFSYRRNPHMFLGHFFKDRSASVAPMLALSIVPLIGMAGAAVDFSRANSARAAFQSALDSTALTLAKNAATQSADQIQTSASNYFNAVFTRADVRNTAITASYASGNGSTIVLSGSARLDTSFLKVMGVNDIQITGSTTSKWGNTRLRVALVLDNTGSMAQDGKMTALKTAAQNLLNQLKNAATNDGDVYVSIIPFSKDVNADPANYQQSWVRWDLWDAANGTCTKSSNHTQSACNSHNGVWTPASHSTWNGCVTDRDQNFDTTNDAPATTVTKFPAEQYDSCSVPLLGLTYDWTALGNKINAMTPVGNTNQAIGLQWGWQSLTKAPFTIPAQDPNYKYNQVIILLTDGLNTQDRWYTSQNSIDAREQKTCDNIKAGDITIYAVQVNTGGDPTSTLLKNCASDAGKFFLLTSANEIITTFSQIGTALSNLRLTM